MDFIMRLSGVSDDSTQGKSVAQTGCKFSWTDAATITLTPDGIDSRARIIVISGNKLKSIILNAALTCALSTSGAGGLDTGSEANNKGYYVFLITKPNGKIPVLLCSLSDTSPTMPAGYTFRSDPIWFISNNGSGDIRKFIDVNGTCYYNQTGDTAVVSQGLAYSDWQVIDCSVIIPSNSMVNMHGYARARNTSGAWNSIRWHVNGTDTNTGLWRTLQFNYVHRVVNASPGVHLAWKFPMVDNEEGFYYKWHANPGSTSGTSYPPNFYVWCRGWRLT
jgi:hypothetical protein